ncbi:MAG: hypothetical protein JO247_21685, partial [Chloroflexi bacterium]|nr:hypothetical protein [Chloroflexota bacterium]
MKVTELLDLFPFDQPPVALERDDELLLTTPHGGREPDPEPLAVVSFSPVYVPKPFSPPKYVYNSPQLRVEWQDMNGRQPFYHRNLDLDELSFQVAGSRQLVTELGSVDLEPGDFVRIPAGVAHGNWGRQDIHLLFYVDASVEDQLPGVRRSEPHTFR